MKAHGIIEVPLDDVYRAVHRLSSKDSIHLPGSDLNPRVLTADVDNMAGMLRMKVEVDEEVEENGSLIFTDSWSVRTFGGMYTHQ